MSSTLSRLGRNLRWLLLSEAAGRAVGFVYTAILARILGLQDFGLLTLATVYSELFFLIANFSFHEILIRDWARSDRRDTVLLGRMFLLQCLLLPLVAGMGYGIGIAYGGLLAVLLPLGALRGWFRGVARTFLAVPAAREDFRPLSVHNFLERIVGLAGIAVLLLVRRDLVTLFAALAAGSAVALAFPIVVAHRHAAFHGWMRQALSGWGGLIRDGASFSMLRWAGILYNRLDMILIERLVGAEAVGLYGAAYRLMEIFKLLPNLAENTLLPVISRAARELAEVRRVLIASMKSLILLTLPLVLLAWAVGGELIRFVFGEEFQGAGTVFGLLMGVTVLISANRPFLVLLRVKGRLGTANLATGSMILLKLAVDLVSIPRFGITGAAAVALLCEAVLLVWLWRTCWTESGGRSVRMALSVLPSFLAGAAATGLLRPFSHWGAAAAGVVVYAAILLFVVGIDTEDRKGIRLLMGRESAR